MKFKPNLVIKTSISLGLVTLLLTQVNLQSLWLQIQYLTWPFVGVALLYYTGCQCLSCVRWQIILRSQGHNHSLWGLMSSYFGGMFLNTFLPSSIGGDVYRIYRVSQTSQDPEVAFASVFLERVTGLIALLAIAFIGLPPAINLVGSWDIILLLLACTIVLAGAVLLMVSPQLLMRVEPWLIQLKLQSLAGRFAKIQILLRQFAQAQKTLVITMLLSFLLQLLLVYYYFLVSKQLQIHVSYLELLVFIPIITIISLLPISLGGLGVKEGLVSYLFSRVGLSVEQGVLLSISVTLLGWILSLPGALVLWHHSPPLFSQKAK